MINKNECSEIKNAVIDGTTLGYQDHGILTCTLSLDYKGSGQRFGGWSLDSPYKPNGEFKGRYGTAYGMQFIQNILRVVGVSRWEDLIGKHVRVDANWNKVCGLGNIIKDDWFYPEQFSPVLVKEIV